MTAKIGPTKLFRNRISGDRFLAAEKPNGDVYYADLDENNNPVNACIFITRMARNMVRMA
jgi:hypothetical protein